jgi:hypothetical protein
LILLSSLFGRGPIGLAADEMAAPSETMLLNSLAFSFGSYVERNNAEEVQPQAAWRTEVEESLSRKGSGNNALALPKPGEKVFSARNDFLSSALLFLPQLCYLCCVKGKRGLFQPWLE